jgi:hypothetical protein
MRASAASASRNLKVFRAVKADFSECKLHKIFPVWGGDFYWVSAKGITAGGPNSY